MIKTYLDVSLYKDKLLYLQKNYDIFKKEFQDVPIEKYNNLSFMKDIVDEEYRWKVYPITYKWKTIDFCDYASQSAQILKEIDAVNGGFSLFLPKTETNLHAGTTPYTYRIHLGLDVPDGCGFICNEKDLSIKNEEINFFDATDIHKAWNNSDKNRIILIVDLIKPDIDKNLIKRGDKQETNVKLYKDHQ
jgi:hypothetical protein